MRMAIKLVRGLLGITGIVQLFLGVVFWSGHWKTLIPFHMINGLVFVGALWTLAALTARAGAPAPLVVTAFAWGLVLPAFGMAQMRILPGPAHWVVQVAHLLTGIVAMGLGGALEKRARVAARAGAAVERGHRVAPTRG